jgi:hypothetical protein
MHAFTKRNHYNPCFWTGLWNPDYFEACKRGDIRTKKARKQNVFALGVLANKVYLTKVDRVHYAEGLGIAEVTPDAMKQFCKKRFPEQYEKLACYVDENPESLFMDFEGTLTGVEHKGGYDLLIEAAMLGDFSSSEHKGFITCLLVIHAMRSYEMMASMVEMSENIGMPKWEYFWLLKNAWANQFVLARATVALACARWTLYRTDDHRFPLCDSPIMMGQDSIMAVLSPRLLVEIDLNVASSEDAWVIRDGISFSKYREFRRRSIGNTFREIIFHDSKELECWRDTPEFKARLRSLADPTVERQLVADAANRIIWGINGFGCVPREFESWLHEHPNFAM